jgi:hypothetical protein
MNISGEYPINIKIKNKKSPFGFCHTIIKFERKKPAEMGAGDRLGEREILYRNWKNCLD